MPLTKATWFGPRLGLVFDPPAAAGVAAAHVAVAAKHGSAPATKPLSYLQLNAIHGKRFAGWYCRCVVWLKSSSWSMRNTLFPTGMIGIPPPIVRQKSPAI